MLVGGFRRGVVEDTPVFWDMAPGHNAFIFSGPKVREECQHDCLLYRGADKSLALPNSRCILFDGKNISFDARVVIYIYIVLILLQL
jgi:hypothetical protein